MKTAPDGGDSCPDHDKLIALTVAFREFRAEVDRRLAELNHAREEEAKDREMFVRIDTYEDRHKQLEKAFQDIASWQQRAIGVGVAAMIGSSLIGVLIGHVFFK